MAQSAQAVVPYQLVHSNMPSQPSKLAHPASQPKKRSWPAFRAQPTHASPSAYIRSVE